MLDSLKNRYGRHIILEEIGEEGQERLLRGKVLIIGAGGLGSPIALYLAAAGVGTIGIADGDRVDISNLQRQIIHSTEDIDRPKVISARDSILALSPHTKVNTYFEFMEENTLFDIAKEYDFVIDAVDSFKAKLMINDACVRAEKPFNHGGIEGFGGQLMTCIPKETTCLRCIFPDYPVDSYEPIGVIGALPGTIGSLQAMEAIKFLTGAGNLITNELLTYDALKNTFRKIPIPRNKGCKVCGE